jgi:GNAT superfamily N-acetyltransferase
MKDVFADLALSRRLERAEALAAADYIDARRQLGAASEWAELHGVIALFDGLDSPSTQTFGLGLFEPASVESLEKIESFFADRGAPALHEVSPLAGIATLSILHERGYRPVELSNILVVELPRASRDIPAIAIREATGPADIDVWTRTSAAAWGMPDAVDLFRTGPLQQRSTLFLAEIDGGAVAAASVSINDGIALLAGAATIPEWRGRGAQRALLNARLEHAAANSCDLAMMGAEPGGASQRNAERKGFRIAYTRTKWRRD